MGIARSTSRIRSLMVTTNKNARSDVKKVFVYKMTIEGVFVLTNNEYCK